MDLGGQMDELFGAFSAQDTERLRAVTAPGFRASRNGGPAVDMDTLLAGLAATMWGFGLTGTYSDIRRVLGDHAVAEQHLVTMARPDGVSVDIDVCVVVLFDDAGLVTRLDEYADPALTAPLRA